MRLIPLIAAVTAALPGGGIGDGRSQIGSGVVSRAMPSPTSDRQSPIPPQGSDATYYFLMGRYLEDEGRIDDAIAAHKHAIELAPDSAELRAELAGLYARQDRAREALEAAEDALKHNPDNQEANRVLGTVYAALADQRQQLRPGDRPSEYAAKAIAALEKSRKEGVPEITVDLMLGRLYVQTGAFVKAIPPLRRVADEQPGYGDGGLMLALAQEGAGAPDDAIATLERTLREAPTFARGQLHLAELYEKQQRWTDAADLYARMQSANPRMSGLGTRRAAALINAGKPAEARQLLEKAVGDKAGEADPVALYLLAEAQRASNDLAAAEATAQKLLSASPGDARGLHVLAQVQQDKGDVKGAERTLRELIGRDPIDATALNSLGYMFAERGERLDEAVELLQRAVKIEPSNPSYLDSLGWAYFQQGRLELADPPLSEAAAKLTQSSVVQEHLGDLRFKQQRYADAASAWERALAGDGVSIDRAKIEKKIRDARSRLDVR